MSKNLALNLLIKAKDLASGTVRKFSGEVEKTAADTEQLGKEFDNTGRSAEQFGEELDNTRRAHERLTGDTRGRNFWGRWRKGANDGTQDTRKFKDELNTVPNATGKAEGGIKRLTQTVIALGGTYLGINALKNAITGLVNVGSRFEDMQVQLNTLMGSVEQGEQAVAWIKDFAATTPADIEGVTQGFIKLKAFGIDPMNGSYQAIIDQTAKLGFSQEKLDGVILAVGQAWTKQKLQGEEALQLIERGVPVWDLLAKATGKTTVELQKMSSAGELGRKEIALLIAEMGKSSEGAAAEAMKTWTGLVSNLKDMWLNFVNDINESGFLDYAKEQLQTLLDQIKTFAADGTLKRWAKEISDRLIAIAEGFKAVIKFTAEWATELGYLAAAIVALKLAAFVASLGKVAAGMRTATTATTGLTAATEALGAAEAKTGKGWGWLGRAGSGLKNLAGYLVRGGRLLTGLGLLAAGVKEVADNWREARREEAAAVQAQQQAVLDAIDRQHEYLGAMNTQLKTEEELKRISREGYEAYAQRLQNAQAYWQARVDEERKLIEQGRERQQQALEAAEQLGKYTAAQETLKQVVTDVNALQSQGLAEVAAAHEALAEQSEARAEAEKKAAEEVGDAYKALGLNFAELTGGVTEQGQAASDALLKIADTGELSAKQLLAVFNQSLAKGRTQADLELMQQSLEQLRQQGKLTGQEYRTAFKAVSKAIKAFADDTKDATDEVDDLNKALDDSGKTSGAKGALGELIKTMRELAKEVRAVKEEYEKAGEAAQKMASSGRHSRHRRGERGEYDREDARIPGARSTRSRGAVVAERLRMQGRDDAAEILLENLARGKYKGKRIAGIKGVEKWWDAAVKDATAEADTIAARRAELEQLERAMAAGDKQAAKRLLAERERFADLNTDLLNTLRQARQMTQQPAPPAPTRTPQTPVAPVRTVRIELPGGQGFNTDETSAEHFLKLLNDVGAASR